MVTAALPPSTWVPLRTVSPEAVRMSPPVKPDRLTVN